MTALCKPMIHVKLLDGDLYNSRILLNVKEYNVEEWTLTDDCSYIHLAGQ